MRNRIFSSCLRRVRRRFFEQLGCDCVDATRLLLARFDVSICCRQSLCRCSSAPLKQSRAVKYRSFKSLREQTYTNDR